MSYKSSIYILDRSPLSDIGFANIFSHSVDCLFILLMVSSEALKFFILMKLYIFFFPLDYAFGVASKKPLSQGHKNYSSVFSPSSSLALIFRSVIHFELSFLYGNGLKSSLFK